VHSTQTVLALRSAKAFILGVCGAVFMISTLMVPSTVSKASGEAESHGTVDVKEVGCHDRVSTDGKERAPIAHPVARSADTEDKAGVEEYLCNLMNSGKIAHRWECCGPQ
jgi:hypothetical protein